MKLEHSQFRRYVRRQTALTVVVGLVASSAGVTLSILSHGSYWGVLVAGFGLGYMTCRLVQVEIERRFTARQAEFAELELRRAQAGRITIE
jgi:hypothetical protein